MSLNDWYNNDWLKRHQTSREEIGNLIKIIERDLQDSQLTDLSLDWQFAISYNAALQCCTVALCCNGFKPGHGQSEHYRTIESLTLTMGPSFNETRDYLNVCRAKRNVIDYDAAGTVSRQEVQELSQTAQELFDGLKGWLRKNYPQYI